MSIEQILDDKTSKLLLDLRCHHGITFQQRDINYCEVYTLNKQSTIFYNPANVDKESIAHELLHIWLRQFNYTIGNHIYFVFESHPKLSRVFTKFLCDYISNCLDHIKMFPKYLEMGYSSEKFLTDGTNKKCSLGDIRVLNLRSLGRFSTESVNRYIGYLLSIYADHAQNDYSQHMELLANKDLELFQITTDFWNNWVEFDITKIDPVFNSDLELAESYIADMETWVEKRTKINYLTR